MTVLTTSGDLQCHGDMQWIWCVHMHHVLPLRWHQTAEPTACAAIYELSRQWNHVKHAFTPTFWLWYLWEATTSRSKPWVTWSHQSTLHRPNFPMIAVVYVTIELTLTLHTSCNRIELTTELTTEDVRRWRNLGRGGSYTLLHWLSY